MSMVGGFRFICVLGGPGSGRGTHCRRLGRELAVAHFSTGALLRQAVEAGHQAAGDIEGAMAAGEPVADPVVFGLLKSAIRAAVREEPERVVALDGFPRDAEQTRWMQRTFGEPELVVFLDCPHDVMVQRVTGRDNPSGAPRADNTETAAHTLIHRFNVDTLPIMDVFGTKVKILQTEGAIEQVYQDLLVCVGGRIKRGDGGGSPVAQTVDEVLSPLLREAVADAASPSKDDAAAAAECAKAALDELIKLPPEHVAPLLIEFVDSAGAFLANQVGGVATQKPPLEEPQQQLPRDERFKLQRHESATKIQAKWRGKRARQDLADEMRLARARAAVELADKRKEQMESQVQDKLQKERDNLKRVEQKQREKAIATDRLNSVLARCGLENFLAGFVKAGIGVERMLNWDREKMARKLGITRVGLSTQEIEALVRAMVAAGYHPVAAKSQGYMSIAVVDDAEAPSELQRDLGREPEPEPEPELEPDNLSTEQWEEKLRRLLQEERVRVVRTGSTYHGLKLFRLDKEVTYMCTDTQQLTTSMLVAVDVSDNLLSNAGYAARVGGRGGSDSSRKWSSPSVATSTASGTASATAAGAARGQLRKKYNGVPEMPPEEGGLFEAHFVAAGKLGLSFNGARNVSTGQLQIVVTQNNAPPAMAAAAAYIEPRDVLQSVQGQSVKDRRLPDVINMILAAGRPLTLTFLRPALDIEARLKREEVRLVTENENYERRMRAAQAQAQAQARAQTHKASSSPEREAREIERMKQEREAKVNQILGFSNSPDVLAQHTQPYHGSPSPAADSGDGGSSKKIGGQRRRRRPADDGSPMRHRTVRNTPNVSLVERSMESAKKKAAAAQADKASPTPSSDVWGPPPWSDGISIQGTNKVAAKRKGGPLPIPTRGGTPTMMRGGFRQPRVVGKQNRQQKSGKRQQDRSKFGSASAAPTLGIKRGPLPQPVRGGTPSMMRGGFRKPVNSNAAGRRQRGLQEQDEQRGKNGSGAAPGATSGAGSATTMEMQRQLAENNAELTMLASELRSLASPSVEQGTDAQGHDQPEAAADQQPPPRAASVPPDLGASANANSTTMSKEITSAGLPAVPAVPAVAQEIFTSQVATQSLEQVESQLFTKLEALSRLSIGEGEDNRGGEREAGVKEGRVSGEKLNHIFHDLYVGMAQTAHQNHVLTHRLNRMEQIVSADDDNRAQIAQHIAGLRNSAEQTAVVVNELSGALSDKADVRQVESTVSGISALGRNLTELAQLVQTTARDAGGGGGGSISGRKSLPDFGGGGGSGGDHSRRRSTGATRVPGSSMPKASGGGGGRFKRRGKGGKNGAGSSGAPSMLGRPRVSDRHAAASAPVGSVPSNAKLDEQLAKQWPSMRMANSSAGLSGISHKLPVVT